MIVETGATWDVDYNDIGPTGTGTMIVRDGGGVTAIDATIGQNNGTGTLTVQGTGSTWSQTSDLLIAFTGTGTLNVLDGGYAYVGGDVGMGENGGDATVNVEGAGSLWDVDGSVSVGLDAANALNILDGGEVTVGGNLLMGSDNNGDANVTVRGAGSRLQVVGDLAANGNGQGTLNISEGGTVEAGGIVIINPDSTINLAVTGDDMLRAGVGSTDDFINDGTVNLLAPGSLAAGTYTPISAGGGFDDAFGTYNAVGGSWNATTHEFAVSAITSVAPTDLSGARVLYYDSLVVSFGDGVGEEAFSVTELSIDEIEGELVLGAFDFDTDLAELTMLSFLIGEGFDPMTLTIRHLADGALDWEVYDPTILDYTGDSYAFSVTSFSSYAVTTTVPEPSAAALLAIAAGAFAWRRRETR